MECRVVAAAGNMPAAATTLGATIAFSRCEQSLQLLIGAKGGAPSPRNVGAPYTEKSRKAPVPCSRAGQGTAEKRPLARAACRL